MMPDEAEKSPCNRDFPKRPYKMRIFYKKGIIEIETKKPLLFEPPSLSAQCATSMPQDHTQAVSVEKAIWIIYH